MRLYHTLACNTYLPLPYTRIDQLGGCGTAASHLQIRSHLDPLPRDLASALKVGAAQRDIGGVGEIKVVKFL